MAAVGHIADTVSITYARSQIAPLGEYGCFHVVTQFVRRAFLCGSVQLTSKHYSMPVPVFGPKLRSVCLDRDLV